MNISIDRLHLSFTVWVLVSLLSMTSWSGCANTDIAPASKLSSGKVTLSWNNVPGAISYNIYFSRSPGVTKINGFKIRNATSPFTIIDLEPGKVYYFVITVVDESGESGESREKSFTATDTGGSVNFDGLFTENQASKAHTTNDPASEGQVTVAWDNVPQAVSYNIYWKDSPGVTRQNGKKIANVMNPYTIKGLERGKKYYMVVTAVAPSGESMESEELSFTVK